MRIPKSMISSFDEISYDSFNHHQMGFLWSGLKFDTLANTEHDIGSTGGKIEQWSKHSTI